MRRDDSMRPATESTLRDTLGGTWRPIVAVVDPDGMRRRPIIEFLRSQDCEVQYFSTAEDALRFVQLTRHERAPDLVVAHDDLPDMTGMVLKQRICGVLGSGTIQFAGYADGDQALLLQRLQTRVRAVVNQRRMRQVNEELHGTTVRLKARLDASKPPPARRLRRD